MNKRFTAPALASLIMMTVACGTRNTRDTTLEMPLDSGPDISDVGEVLDAWHDAAHRGDIDSYFNATTEGFVFLGTDPTERWTRKEFRAFAAPHFADGHGWTYTAVERYVHKNAYGDVAWVDETLHHDTYGTLRGTAVLRSLGYSDDWRIAHYSLSFLIPNNKTEAMLEAVRDAED